ncbi:MAG: recombinase family protein [Candidatus Omnitrophica bacterium]|nr:recombinase family protein [Candidatus Omnitrophota bacterium]
MEKRCGIYARVSTEMQANMRDGSVDTQISQMQSFLNYKTSSDSSWKIAKIYAEKGKSGKNTDRPELQELFADIKEKKVNTVICTKIDRISRSLMDFYKMTELFEKNNVEFISLDENFDTSTPMGKAALKITLVFAELEREQTSKRTKDKMAWRAEQGLWNGGQVLGYDLIEKKLVPNKSEASLVKLMFEKYIELGSVMQVTLWLSKNGYRTKNYTAGRSGRTHGGKKFSTTTVTQKLRSRVYIGEVYNKGKIFPGQHEAIIPKSLWKQVNALIDKNAPIHKNPKRLTQHIFILQGLLRCGWCNSYMTTKYAHGKNGSRHYYYQCTKNSHGGKDGCEMKYVPAAKVEQVVLQKIRSLSVNKEFLDQIVAKANESMDIKFEELVSSKKGYENKLVGIKGQISNIIDVLAAQGLKDKSIGERLNTLEEQRSQLEETIHRIGFELDEKKQKIYNAEIVHNSLKKFSQIYDKAKPMEIKELLPYFVESIGFTPDEIKIALFDQPIDKGLFSVNHSSGCSLELSKWLPREGSNLGHCGYFLTPITWRVGLSLSHDQTKGFRLWV